MSLKFIQEDRRGNAYDKSGNEPIEMEVYSEQLYLVASLSSIRILGSEAS